MSNIQKTKELLKRYSIARIPFIVIDTIEPSRTLDVLKEISSNKTLNDDRSIYGAIDFMTEQMKRRQYLTIILTEVPDLSNENVDSKQILALVNLANESGGVVIVLNNNSIWNQLQRQGMMIHMDLPDEQEMYSIIKNYIDDYRNEIFIEWDDIDIREASSTLTGVTKIEAENVIAALIAKKEIKKADMQRIDYFLIYLD